VWAAPQRDQGGRHPAFIDGHSARWGLAVLVAPEVWIIGHAAEAVSMAKLQSPVVAMGSPRLLG